MILVGGKGIAVVLQEAIKANQGKPFQCSFNVFIRNFNLEIYNNKFSPLLCWSLKNSSLSLRHNSPRQSPASRPPLPWNLFPSCTILQSSFFLASELSIACISWQSSFDWYPGNSTFFCEVSFLVLRPLIFAGESFLHAWFCYLATEISRENGCLASAVSFVWLHPSSSSTSSTSWHI